MKKLFIFFGLIFTGILLLTSCKKEDIQLNGSTIPPNALDTNSLFKMIWQVPLSDDTSSLVSGKKIYHNGNLINLKGFGGPNNILCNYNGNSGKLIWSWTDYRIDDGSESDLMDGLIIKDKNLFLGTHKYSFFIDPYNGENIFVDKPDLSKHRFLVFNSLVDNLIFRTIDPIDGPNSQYSELVYYDIQDLDSAKLFFHQANENDFAPYLQSVAGYYNQNQELIVLFQNRQYRFSPGRGKIDLILYNFSKDTLIWKKEDLTVSRSSNVLPPIIYKERIYFAGSKNIYCLDLTTGNEIWHSNPSPTYSGYYTSHYKIINDKLIVNDDEWNLMALNPSNGEKIWQVSDVGNSNTLEHYDNYLFTGSNDLNVINLQTGKLIEKYQSPNKVFNSDASFYSEGIAVDPENKRIFVSDGYFLMCLEINN
jgi:outer membrane protein assembly factor BamB